MHMHNMLTQPRPYHVPSKPFRHLIRHPGPGSIPRARASLRASPSPYLASSIARIMDIETSNDEKTLQSFEISVKGLENVASAEARGTGSNGSVYEVEAHGLPCIAKCIHPVLIRYEQQMQGARRDVAKEKATIRTKFYKECILLSKLRHPNIVQFMGVARVPNTGEMALIMEALFSDLGNFVEQHKDISDPIKVSLM